MEATRVCRECGTEKTVTDFRCINGVPMSRLCSACRLAAKRRGRAELKAGRVSQRSDWAPPPKYEEVLGRSLSFDVMGLVATYEGLARAACENGVAGAQHISWACTTLREVLAKARVWGFERTNRRRVTNDGTVTDEFLIALYETSCCVYCHKETPPDKRTADHKVPLARGGAHSASNLVMACVKCNNRKHAKSAEVFIAQLAAEKASGGEG